MKISLALLYCIFILLLSEGASRFSIHIINNIYNKEITLTDQDREAILSLITGGNNYIAYDPDLGWVLGRNVKAELYESNNLGVRSTREYSPQSLQVATKRILAFGDSFTHSDDVPNKDAWTTILESENKNLEVLNYGVPAYGIDQAYLRFQKESAGVLANIVLIGMMSENVYRHINTFRKFYQRVGGFPLGKPRFIENGSLSVSLLPNWFGSAEKYHELLTDSSATLREVGSHDFYYNNKPPAQDCGLLKFPCAFKIIGWFLRDKIDRGQKDPLSGFLHYDMTSEAPRLTVKIIRSFADAVTAKNMRPIVVIFPNKTDYYQYKITGLKNYTPLLKTSIESGIESWDAMEAFIDSSHLVPYEEVFTKSSGHYSDKGNHLIAKWMAKKLNLKNY